MKREIKLLLYTKIGFIVAFLPILIVASLGSVEGYAAAAVVAMMYGGAALWGYGYGALSEREVGDDE